MTVASAAPIAKPFDKDIVTDFSNCYGQAKYMFVQQQDKIDKISAAAVAGCIQRYVSTLLEATMAG
jgi:hypothetical protein